MLKNTTSRFGSVSQLFHWLIFILFTLQFLLIWRKDALPKGSPEKLSYMLMHKSVGVTVFMLGILFILWRMMNVQPIPPASQSRWKLIAATIVHKSLLTLMVLMPLVGYLLSCAAGKAVSFFGLFALPSLVPENKYLASIMDAAHGTLAVLICILVGIHVLAALQHHFIIKDNVLKRMLPFISN